MSDVKRFMAPGPWITRDLKECVRASDYDALRAERDALRDWQRKARAWLLSHQRHDEDCAASPFRAGFKTRECDCGLDDLIAQSRTDRRADEVRALLKEAQR